MKFTLIIDNSPKGQVKNLGFQNNQELCGAFAKKER